MTTRRLRTALVFAPIPIGIVIASADCYGPTQATISLTSIQSRARQMRVAIYKGVPGALETTPQAETNHCTTTGAETAIGDLVFVPASDKEARVAVRAVLALGGKTPDACLTDAANCILATRSFAFEKHTSRAVPIRFLDDCIGAVCPSGSTCAGGRKCVSDECLDDQCTLSPNAVADAAVAELPDAVGSGADGGPPKPGDDAGDDGAAPFNPECTANGTNILATHTTMPTLATASPGDIYWAQMFPGPDAASPILQRTAKDSGATTPAFLGFGKGESIQALGYQDDFLVAGGSGSGASLVKTGGDGGSVFLSPSGTTSVSAIAGRPTRFTIATNNDKVYERPTVSTPFAIVHDKAATHIVGRDDDYFAATASGVVRIVPGQPAPGALVANSPANALLASLGTTVYALGADGAKWSLWEISPGSATKHATQLEPATSFAVDATDLYWIDTANVLRRVAIAGGTSAPLVSAAGVTLDHVAVDDRCLYFWSQRAGERATLRSVPKRPLATLSAGPPP